MFILNSREILMEAPAYLDASREDAYTGRQLGFFAFWQTLPEPKALPSRLLSSNALREKIV
jgi:hypothetical protein